MSNVMGFYILSRVWDYLLHRNPYDSDAQNLISRIKIELIFAEDTDNVSMTFLVNCQAWQQALGVAAPLEEVAL